VVKSHGRHSRDNVSPLRINALQIRLLVSVLVLACAPFSFAGPMFPCPAAVNSVQGNTLAIVHSTIESENLCARDFSGGDWPWGIALDMNNQADRNFTISCAVPLVGDDARFLILLAAGPAFGTVLRIYRQGDSSERLQDGAVKGVLTRDYA
jgi:hypothetical protein